MDFSCSLWSLRAFLSCAKRSTEASLRHIVLFCGVSMLPLLPWLVKNLYETGNPLFPLMNNLFHGRPIAEVPALTEVTRRRLIYGESWLEIVSTPLRVFVTGVEND